MANLYVGRLDYTPAGQPISLVELRHPDLARKKLLEHYIFGENEDPGEHLPHEAKGILGDLTPPLIRHMHQWLTGRLG